MASSIPLVDSWVKVTVFDTNSPFHSSVADQANSRLIAGVEGVYLGFLSHDAVAALANKVYEVDAFVIQAATVAVTGITQANPAVVTAVAHGRSNGDVVKLSDITGMVKFNDRLVTVANKAADTFEAKDAGGTDISSIGFTAYGSGGLVQLATNALMQGQRRPP